jgi:rubrerythrin
MLTSQEIEAALVVIRRAIHNEIAGQRFYNDAAYACIDPWAKEVFATLATEEQVHTRLLLLEYKALTDQGRWLEPSLALESTADVDITQVTFPDEQSGEELFPAHWSAGQVVDRRASDLDALAFGIDLETRAIEVYGQAGQQELDPAARTAYQFLVDEETRHYHLLKAQWEKLAGRPLAAGRPGLSEYATAGY